MQRKSPLAANQQAELPRSRLAGMLRGLKSAGIGLTLGVAYPVVASILAIMRNDQPFSWKVLWNLHRDDEFLHLVDSIPIVLMVLMGVIGRTIAKVDAVVDTLEQRVAQRTKALSEQKEKAENTARARARFLSRLSRDIAGSMDAIVRASEMVLGTSLDARQHEQAQSAVKHARRVQDAMQSVQTVSDIDAGEIEIRERVFSPRHLLSDAIARVEKRLSRRFEVVVRYADELPLHAAADAAQILKIFMTLLRSVVLNLEGGRINIDVAQVGENQARNAVLNVEISSPDLFLSPHVVTHFFDAFERDDPLDFAQDTKLELELSVARRVAQVLRGDLGIQSVTGGGTRIYMRIPYRIGISQVNQKEPALELDLESLRAG